MTDSVQSGRPTHDRQHHTLGGITDGAWTRGGATSQRRAATQTCPSWHAAAFSAGAASSKVWESWCGSRSENVGAPRGGVWSAAGTARPSPHARAAEPPSRE